MISKRIYGLDILRCIAILTVMIGHFCSLHSANAAILFERFFPDGVALFFVLSGFLIGGILLRKCNETDFNFYQLRTFWVRRWLRTLPAYYATILFLLVVLYFHHLVPPKKLIVETLTFTQSLFKEYRVFYGEGWSLCIEEWFYLLVPIMLLCIYKAFKFTWKKTFLITILSIIIITSISRIFKVHQINYLDVHQWDISVRRPVFYRLDSIMYGVLGAYLYFYNYKIWNYKNLFFFLGIGLFVLFQFTNFIKIKMYFNLPIESLWTLLILPKLNSIKSGRGIVFKTITFISIISYSLYLLNYTPFLRFIYPVYLTNTTSPSFSKPLYLLLYFSPGLLFQHT